MFTSEICAKAYAWSNLWVECHPGTAAWVQAIGSILALLLAITVPIYVNWLSAKSTKKALLKSLAGMVVRGKEVFANLQLGFSNRDSAADYLMAWEGPANIASLQKAFDEAPIHAVGDAELMLALLDIRAALERANWLMDSYQNYPGPGAFNSFYSTYADLIRQLTKDAFERCGVVEKMIGQRLGIAPW